MGKLLVETGRALHAEGPEVYSTGFQFYFKPNGKLLKDFEQDNSIIQFMF